MFTRPLDNVSAFGFLPGQKVADLGAGAGHYSQALSKVLGPKGRVYAVDLNKDMLLRIHNEAKKEGRDNIRLIEGNVEAWGGTKLKEEVADGAIFGNILFFLDNKENAANEASRIVKKGGRVCVIEWSDESFVSRMSTDGVRRLIKEDEVKALFEQAGLSFEKNLEAGDHHYGLIFKKSL